MHDLNTRERKRSTNLKWYRVEEEARTDGTVGSVILSDILEQFWWKIIKLSRNIKVPIKYGIWQIHQALFHRPKGHPIHQKWIAGQMTAILRPIWRWLLLRLTNNLGSVSSPSLGQKNRRKLSQFNSDRRHWWIENYFSEIGHFRVFIFHIIHMKVLTDTIPMMYRTYHLIEQLRRYFDFSFLSW